MSGSDDETLRLWEADSGFEIRRFEGHQSSVQSVAFSPDGRHILSGGYNHTLILWEAETGRETCRFDGHQNQIRSVAFSPDARRLLSGGDDNSLRLWDAESGVCLLTWVLLPDGWAAFTPEGRYKTGGNVKGHFWHTIGLARFEVGELEEFMPGLRIPDHEPMLRPA